MKPTGVKFFLLVGVMLFVMSLPSLAAVESLRFDPFPFNSTTGVTVEVVTAENRPDVSLEYRWYINDNEQFFEKTTHLPGHLFRRGDQIVVEVIPVTYVGERLTPIISRPIEATNAPPEILSEPPEDLTESGFRYQVVVVDPDGDAVTFRLEDAPEQMTINATSGQILWPFDTMPEGVFPIRMIVEDGQGGQAEQTFELHMAFEK